MRLDLSAVGRCAREALLVLVSLTGVLTRRRSAQWVRRGPVEVVGVRWGQFLEVLAAESVTGLDVMCAGIRALPGGTPGAQLAGGGRHTVMVGGAGHGRAGRAPAR